MAKKQKNVVEKDEVNLEAELTALIEGAEIAPVAEASPELVEEAVAELVTDEIRAEAYAEQPAETAEPSLTAEPVVVAGVSSEPAPARKARVAKLSLASAKASDVIQGILGSEAHKQFFLDTTEANDDDSLRARMNAVLAEVDGIDKKSREKVVNIFSSVLAGRAPSVYTMQALRALKAKGSLSLKDLVGIYQTEHKYQIGTARRQASEMFAFFPILKIAEKGGRGAPLVFNANSTLAQRFLEPVATTA